MLWCLNTPFSILWCLAVRLKRILQFQSNTALSVKPGAQQSYLISWLIPYLSPGRLNEQIIFDKFHHAMHFDQKLALFKCICHNKFVTTDLSFIIYTYEQNLFDIGNLCVKSMGFMGLFIWSRLPRIQWSVKYFE